MTRIVARTEWRPVGVDDLEAAAWEAVTDCAQHQLIVAGPGAGKTELLAQRAAYLLQTESIPHNRRILALAFKKDAAANLGERVRRRCGPELAERFVSCTIDAFAKSLVDRFRAALPVGQQPTADFELVSERDARLGASMRRGILTATADLSLTSAEPARTASAVARRYANNPDFVRRLGVGRDRWPIPGRGRIPNAASEAGAAHWATPYAWAEALRQRPSLVSWDMLKRMAICLLVNNPRILRSLRQTYAHVFIDEFQDLNALQLELVYACFPPSEARLTAVGDDRQRIMGFAGAIPGIFGVVADMYGAQRRELVRNYRSDSRLVRIQCSLMRALDGSALPQEAARVDDSGTGQCVVWTFTDAESEARVIARTVASMVGHGIPAHRICILTRQKVSEFAPPLVHALSEHGIGARIEDLYQEITKDPVAQLLRATVAVAVRRRAPDEFSLLSECIERQHCWSSRDHDPTQRVRETGAVLRRRFATLPISGPAITEALLEALGPLFGGRAGIGVGVRPSRAERDVTATAEAFGSLLAECRLATCGWEQALDRLDGHGVVPLMTVHKSKGLEYHAVIFVGLEDSSWWSFRREPDEESRTFFVAFSRAEQRVLFTFSESRLTSSGAARVQARQDIKPLYELLLEAGVETVANPTEDVCRQFSG